MEKLLKKHTAALKVGDVQEFDTFMAAVIDKASFETCKGYIDRAAASPECEFVAGGTYDDSKGWFVQPTNIRAEGLLSHNRAGALVVDVEVAGGVAQGLLHLHDGLPVLGEDGAGRGVFAASALCQP